MKLIKRLFLIMSVFVAIFVLPKAVQAQTIKTLDSKSNVETNKTWTIKFNSKVDMTTANTKNILVQDSNGNAVAVGIASNGNGDSITVNPPSSGYENGKSYTIKVTDGVKSTSGTALSATTVMNFTIKALPQPTPTPTPTPSKPAYTITIDPGHGGYDSGAVGPNGSLEKNVTLAVSLKVGDILKKYNVNVIYTRDSDQVSWPSNVNQDLQKRCDISNNSNSSIFVAIHMNSYSDGSAHGTETYYYPGSSRGQALANSIQTQLVNQIGTTNRGVKTANYYVLRNTNAPAVLTEVAFISNPNEEKELNDPTFQNKAAQGIADGILKYLGLK